MRIKFHPPVLCCLLVTGCVSAPIAPPITSGSSTTLDVSARGLQKHAAYPNDVLWVHIFDGEISKGEKPVGRQRYTVEQPAGSLQLDAKTGYTIVLFSVEGHFGGYSSCATTIPLVAAEPGSTNLSIDYLTQKNSCEAILAVSSAGVEGKKIHRYKGSLGGVQYSAHVVPPP